MKFAQYLNDNKTREWSRFYLDYKALKKIIKKINPPSGSIVAGFGPPQDSDDDDSDAGEGRAGSTAAERLARRVGDREVSNGGQVGGDSGNGISGNLKEEEAVNEDGDGEAGEREGGDDSKVAARVGRGAGSQGAGYGSLDSSPSLQLQSQQQQQKDRWSTIAALEDARAKPPSSGPLPPASLSSPPRPSPSDQQVAFQRLTPASVLHVSPNHGSGLVSATSTSPRRFPPTPPTIQLNVASPSGSPPAPPVPPFILSSSENSQAPAPQVFSSSSSSSSSASRSPPSPVEPTPSSPTKSLRFRSPSSPQRRLGPRSTTPISPRSLLPSPRLGLASPSLLPQGSARSDGAAAAETASSDAEFIKARARLLKGEPAGTVLGSADIDDGPPRTGILAYLGGRTGSVRNPDRPVPHLADILPSLLPIELQFITALDAELDKVEKFYAAREKEMKARVDLLRQQMRELAEHRKIFHEHQRSGGVPSNLYQRALQPLNELVGPIANSLHIAPPSLATQAEPDTAKQTAAQAGLTKSYDMGPRPKESEVELTEPKDSAYDPEAYQRYKRRLKAAILEAYRGLEVLKNFRILNMTGFRKALKKFEKASKVSITQAYMNDRISKQSFSNANTIDSLIEEIESLYAARFEHGNTKQARERLRVSPSTKAHHFSTFRSGVYLGLSMFPLIHGLIMSTHPNVRRAIPNHAALLQVYGAAYIPVVFALAFYINLWAFVTYRINYRFIFELDVRSVLDYRQYAEMPSFLFLTLSGCLWLSFYRVGAENVEPTTWPLAWLIFVIAVFIMPFPIAFRKSRYWFIRTLWRLLTPGWSRVEFSAFFLADELNSLIYSIQTIWFLGCAQNAHWEGDIYAQCNQYNSWVPTLLGCIPPLARMLQCLQRWRESGMRIQLINAGKYLSSILSFLTFYFWRSRGNEVRDVTFPCWIVAATISSVYTASWDLLIDWSVLRPDKAYLRDEIIYKEAKPAYYVAMVTNVLIRFIWVGYIPKTGVQYKVRGFVFAALEMGRRFQWNFFRVENEMIGNIDQYRVTRELPLPYNLDGLHTNDSSDEDEPKPASSASPGGLADLRRRSSAMASKGGSVASLRLSRVASRRRPKTAHGQGAPREEAREV